MRGARCFVGHRRVQPQRVPSRGGAVRARHRRARTSSASVCPLSAPTFQSCGGWTRNQRRCAYIIRMAADAPRARRPIGESWLARTRRAAGPLVSGPARLRALGGPRTRSSRVCGARWVAGRYASGGKIIMRILLPCSRSPFVNHWQDAWCMISCDVECQCGQRATEDKSGRRSWGCRAVLSQNGYIRF